MLSVSNFITWKVFISYFTPWIWNVHMVLKSVLVGSIQWDFPGGSDCKAVSCLQCRRPRFNPWVGQIPWRRKWQSTLGLLPGKSHGHGIQWALVLLVEEDWRMCCWLQLGSHFKATGLTHLMPSLRQSYTSVAGLEIVSFDRVRERETPLPNTMLSYSYLRPM